MAIVQNPLIGKTTQSLGNATFSKWKNKNVLKSKAIKVSNPKTPKQVAHRTKFRLLMSAVQGEINLTRQAFKEASNVMTHFNKFVQLNINNVTLTTPGNVVIAKTNIKTSFGSLPAPSSVELISFTPTNLEFEWDGTYDGITTLASDKLFIVIVDKKTYKVDYKSTEITFSEGNAVINPNITGSISDYYAGFFFVRPEAGKASPTYML